VKTPDDINSLLTELRKPPIIGGVMSDDDAAFLHGLVAQIDAGAKGIVLVMAEDGSLDYFSSTGGEKSAVRVLTQAIRAFVGTMKPGDE
jgi:hypothetical protein